MYSVNTLWVCVYTVSMLFILRECYVYIVSGALHHNTLHRVYCLVCCAYIMLISLLLRLHMGYCIHVLCVSCVKCVQMQDT